MLSRVHKPIAKKHIPACCYRNNNITPEQAALLTNKSSRQDNVHIQFNGNTPRNPKRWANEFNKQPRQTDKETIKKRVIRHIYNERKTDDTHSQRSDEMAILNHTKTPRRESHELLTALLNTVREIA